jgi:hypothetical protein
VLPAPAPITAAAPPSSAAPMNRTASQAQTSSSSSRNAQVTINFSGQNIIDESSKERFLREIMAQMSAMIGKTVTV